METEIDTFLTERLICPWCGEENEDETNEPDGETTCSECEKQFTFERDYTIHYISRK